MWGRAPCSVGNIGICVLSQPLVVVLVVVVGVGGVVVVVCIGSCSRGWYGDVFCFYNDVVGWMWYGMV